jgi:hypothetical protein
MQIMFLDNSEAKTNKRVKIERNKVMFTNVSYDCLTMFIDIEFVEGAI